MRQASFLAATPSGALEFLRRFDSDLSDCSPPPPRSGLSIKGNRLPLSPSASAAQESPRLHARRSDPRRLSVTRQHSLKTPEGRSVCWNASPRPEIREQNRHPGDEPPEAGNLIPVHTRSIIRVQLRVLTIDYAARPRFRTRRARQSYASMTTRPSRAGRSWNDSKAATAHGRVSSGCMRCIWSC